MLSDGVSRIVTDSIPGPKAMEILNRRKKSVARGISCGTELVIKEAKGALIKDIDDNIYIDFTSGIGVQNIGHCDDNVVNAIKEQAEKYIHPSINIASYEPYIALAEKLIEITPGDFPKKVMFANSGAEAVENAVKIARKYTSKPGIICLECAYHGRTYMAMALTSKYKPYKHGFGPFVTDTYKLPSAYCYRCPFGSKFPGCGLACAEKLNNFLKSEISPDQIAALITEPIQGEGGFIVQPRAYLQALESICRKNGIVFIVDEVQTGFARTGKLFACENSNIQPDLMTVSKALAAGMPLSAVVGSDVIMDAPDPGQIGGTYTGNPVACSAALKVIEKINNERLYDRAKHIGDILFEKLNEMKEIYSIIGDVRGLGAMVAIEFVKGRDTKEPYPDIVKKILTYSYKKGVLFLSAGIYSNVLRFLPPLVMTDEQVEYGMKVLNEAIEACM